MITLTDNAKNYLTATTEKHGKKYAYLGVLGGGCSGFQYEWSMTDENSANFGRSRLRVCAFIDEETYLVVLTQHF